MTSRVLRFVEIEGMSLRQLGIAYAVAGAAAASMKAILAKLAYAAAPVSPVVLLNLRMLMALPFFLWLFLRAGSPRQLHMKHWLQLALLGFAGYYFSSLSDFIGLQYVSAGLERLILFTYPTLILLFQVVIFRERPSRRTLLAMGVCYMGLGVALLHDISTAGMGGQVILGAAWVFASAVTYALYYLGTGVMLKRLGSMRLAGLAGSASALMVLVHYGASTDMAQLLVVPRPVWCWR